MTQINAVLFDIGNVLIEWAPHRFFDSVIGAERRRALFAAVDLDGMNERVDRGENFHELLAQTASENPDWATEINLWHDRWIEMVTPQIDHSVRLLRALRQAGVPVFALSNFGVETFEMARKHYPFLAEFDRSYISGQMRVMKPEPAIYQAVEDDTGFDPATLLFTDDRLDNIAAAHARGWQTHVFTGAEGWSACLVDAGLLTAGAAQ